MTAQTSYDINQAVAYAGLVFAQVPSEIASFTVEDVAGIPFGVAVSRGTNTELEITIGGDDAFLGITIRDLGREGAVNTGAIRYDEEETAGVMRSGYLWVFCPTGCNPGDAALYNDTTGIIDAGIAGAGETDIANSEFQTVSTAGELAVLRIK